jgi:hypothetical protein
MRKCSGRTESGRADAVSRRAGERAVSARAGADGVVREGARSGRLVDGSQTRWLYDLENRRESLWKEIENA